MLLKGEVARGYTCCEVGFPLPRPSSYRPPYNPSFHFIFHVVFYLILHYMVIPVGSPHCSARMFAPNPRKLFPQINQWKISIIRGRGVTLPRARALLARPNQHSLTIQVCALSNTPSLCKPTDTNDNHRLRVWGLGCGNLLI